MARGEERPRDADGLGRTTLRAVVTVDDAARVGARLGPLRNGMNWGVAQLAERLAVNQEVEGSSPPAPVVTKKAPQGLMPCGAFFYSVVWFRFGSTALDSNSACSAVTSCGMSLILYRWIVSVAGDVDPRSAVVERLVPALQASGAAAGPDSYYVSRQWEPPERSEAWLTLVASDGSELPDLIDVELGDVPRYDTGSDAILDEGADWYRRALRQVTDIALEVLASGRVLPVSEHEFGQRDPAETVPALVEALHGVSPTFRAACPTPAAARAYLLGEFARSGPSPRLSYPGHWLWNIAG